MKIFELSKDGAQKIAKGVRELYPRDMGDSIKSSVPGEWVLLKNTRKNKLFLAFVNPLSINNPVAHILHEVIDNSVSSDEEEFFRLLQASILKRNYYNGYEDCARLVYGNADNLPGLIVDSYINVIVIQINTAGIDKFRIKIKEFFETNYPSKKIYLLDNEKYRERESLPIYEKERIDIDLKIIENNLNIEVQSKSIQKVGYYYDHRENRLRAKNLLKKINKKFEKGLDLFSYVGSWGLHLLDAGVSNVDFVDQGEMDVSVKRNLEINNFSNRGNFIRENVFDFIKNAKTSNKKFDVICSDPPAFCKSKKEERKAYEGYLKLHKNLMDIIEKDGVLIACSCTYYISSSQFQKNIEEAAGARGRKIHLLDLGVQGFDHPTTSLLTKNSYLKYFAYRVE